MSSHFTKSISFPASAKDDLVRLHFGIKGNYSFHHKQLNKSFDFIGGHHNIMYSKGFDITVQNKTLLLETFDIQFHRDLFINFTQNANELLKIFSENILKGNSALLSEKWLAIDLSIHQVIQQIIHCKYEGEIKKLFLLSKSIELLVLSAEAYNKSINNKNSFIKSTSDKEKLVAVKDLINERLHKPPNLTEICKIAGLNEYKLKRGFKEMFNNTVFGYLTEQRLNLARQYILDTEKTIAEISFELGYLTPQHFNNAFKKKFGITPFSVRNNPKNAMH